MRRNSECRHTGIIQNIVEIDDMIIPVLSLEYEDRACTQLGREDKARFLQDWLARRSSSVGEVSDD